MMIIAVSHVTL